MDGGKSVLDAYNSIPPGEYLALFMIYAVTGAPLVETLIMAAVLGALGKWFSANVAIVLTALAVTLVHRLDGPWGWAVFFPFVIYSYVYLARNRSPRHDGYAVAALAHAISNLVVFALASVDPQVSFRFH